MTKLGIYWNRRDWVVAVGFVIGLLCGVRSGLGQQAQQPCQQCQPINFAAPYPIWGVDSAAGCGCSEVGWDARGMIPWQEFAQGEYVGHARTPHVPEYRIREGDVVAIYYRRTRDEISRPYEIQVGDRLKIESLTSGRGPSTTSTGGDAQASDDSISRELVVQPD